MMDVKRLEKGEMIDEECDLLAQELKKVMNIIGVDECDTEEEAEEVVMTDKNVISKVENTAADSTAPVSHDIVESAEEEEDYSIIKTLVFTNKSIEKDTTEEISSTVQVEELPTKIGLVIIRNLPPTMTENEFYTEISPIPEYDFFFYVIAEDESKFSRAYINFICPDNIHPFYDTFNNSKFYDSYGYKYRAQVDLAPFCNILKYNQDKYITYIGYMKRIKKKVNERKPKIRKRNTNNRIIEKNEETSSKVVSWLASIEKNSEAVTIENIEEPKNDRRLKNFDGKKAKEIENIRVKENDKEKKFFFSRNGDSSKDDPKSKRIQTRKISSDQKLSKTQYRKGKKINEKDDPKISFQEMYNKMTQPAEERSKTEIFPAQSKVQKLKGENIGMEKENPKNDVPLHEDQGRPAQEQSKTIISTENKMVRPLSTIVEEVDVKINCGKADEKIFSEKSKKDGSPQWECKDRKDPTPRIRHRDRPSMELYRPGMGKLTKKNIHHPSSTSPSK